MAGPDPVIEKYKTELNNTKWSTGAIETIYKGVSDFDIDGRIWEFKNDSVLVTQYDNFIFHDPVIFDNNIMIINHSDYRDVLVINYLDSTKMIVIKKVQDVTVITNLYKIKE